MAWFDIALIVLLALSTIFAFFRGFVTEALHLAALGGAIIATIIGFPFIEPWLVDKIGSPLAVKIIGNAATFIVVLVLLRVIANFIGSKVRQSEIGIIDRSLGAVFGAIRGFLIVVFLYVLFIRLWQPEEAPEFIQEARLGGLVTAAADALDPYLNGKNVKAIVDKARNAAPAPLSTPEAAPRDVTPKRPAKNKEQAADKGYSEVEREALDRAIDTALDTVLERMRGEESADETQQQEEPPR